MQPTQWKAEGQESFHGIPGGILECLNHGAFTMVEVNQGFLTMFGYTKEELATQFKDSFLNMVHPADRQQFALQATRTQGKDQILSLGFRVLCKDGSYKWIASNAKQVVSDDEKRLFCILLDLDEIRDAQEALRISLEQLRTTMDQMSDIIFEWNGAKDAITYTPKWFSKIGNPPGYVASDGATLQRLHPDDVTPITAFLTAITQGAAQTGIDIRLQREDGLFTWCRIRATGHFDEAGRLLKTVGTIMDINEEKQQIEELRKRAELDALTGLYNHAEVEQRIRMHLESRPKELCALFIIDVDDFKHVNDGQGHLFGDAVLVELAAGLKKLARKTDVVGRIGGDEFAMFLKDIPSIAMAEEKARKLLDIFRNLLQEEKRPVEVTCSIGMALYPEDGEGYQSLYHSADLALYQAKRRGKNQSMRFDASSMGGMEQIGYSSLGAVIDSDGDSGKGTGDNLVNYVFQILYNSSDIDHAIQATLEIVGRRFDVSRTYIFENSQDGNFTDNTYEWCNEGILPQKQFLQHFPYESVKGYRDLFQENAIFYCRDVQSLAPDQAALFKSQGICATLQCAFLEGTAFRGFIGFDECTGLRMWNKEEIGILSLIAQIVTTFLLKKREAERNQQLMLRLNTILDTQDAYIYAIEQGTYELLYLNHKTTQRDPSIKTGMTCHQALFGSGKPCERCPLNGVTEVYNPKYDIWSKVRVSTMKWGSSRADLLTCYDITEYKRLQKPEK